MFSYDALFRINNRSKQFNQELNAVYIYGVMDESNYDKYSFDINEEYDDNKYIFEHDFPYILVSEINEPFCGGFRAIPLRNFIAGIISLKKYAVNIEVLQELFDNYDILNHHFFVDSEYSHGYQTLTVKVYGCVMAEFLPHDFFGEKAAEKMTNRVVKACRKNRLPIGTADRKEIQVSIENCLARQLKKRIEDNDIDNYITEEDGYIF